MITKNCFSCGKAFTSTHSNAKYCNKVCYGVSRRKQIPHGTPGGYTNHKCRCEKCTKTWAEYCKYYIRKHREKIKSHKCVFPNCTKQCKIPNSTRKMCYTHYRMLLLSVKQGGTTWDEIKALVLKP